MEMKLSVEQQQELLKSGRAVKIAFIDENYKEKRLAVTHPNWVCRHQEPAKDGKVVIPGKGWHSFEYEIWEHAPQSMESKKAHAFLKQHHLTHGKFYQSTKSHLPDEVKKLVPLVPVEPKKQSIWEKTKDLYFILKNKKKIL